MNPTPDSTTTIIRRRIRHWKTTIAGVAVLISPIVCGLWPQHAATITQIVLGLTGAGLIAAADGDKTRS